MANRTTLNISLTPELSQFIDDKLKTGLYTSGSEIIREALRLFKSYEDVRVGVVLEMQEKINAGLEQVRQGKVIDGESFLEELEKGL